MDCIEESLLLLTNIIEVLFPQSLVGQIHVSAHVCTTKMVGGFTMADALQASNVNPNGDVRNIKKKSRHQS